MTLLLDTTFLIDVLRKRQNGRALLDQLASAGHVLGTSAISIAEVYAEMRPGEEQKTERLFSLLECFPTTSAIARTAEELKMAAARRGKTIGLPDALIAATALQYQFTLVTNNRKDFSMPGLNYFLFHRTLFKGALLMAMQTVSFTSKAGGLGFRG